MAKTILLLSEKGGVGKSTLYDELCYACERRGIRYASYDLDAQGGTLHPTRKDADAQVALVDTPGAIREDTERLVSLADLVIVPTRASGRDLPPLKRTLRLVRERGKDGALVTVVVNAFNRYTMAKSYYEGLKSLAATPGSGIHRIQSLRQSEAIVKAASYGRSVVDVDRRSGAAEDVERITSQALADVGLIDREA